VVELMYCTVRILFEEDDDDDDDDDKQVQL